MKLLNLTSFYLLVLLILISNATTAFGAPAKSRHGGGKNKEERAKCNAQHPHLCSPPVTAHTKAILTLNSFEKGGSGGGPSECDGKYHSDSTLIVALSSGWFNDMERCNKNIMISAKNGRSTRAKVVDECDSRHGCRNNIVDASEAVWKALGIPKNQRGFMKVTWSDN